VKSPSEADVAVRSTPPGRQAARGADLVAPRCLAQRRPRLDDRITRPPAVNSRPPGHGVDERAAAHGELTAATAFTPSPEGPQ